MLSLSTSCFLYIKSDNLLNSSKNCWRKSMNKPKPLNNSLRANCFTVVLQGREPTSSSWAYSKCLTLSCITFLSQNRRDMDVMDEPLGQWTVWMAKARGLSHRTSGDQWPVVSLRGRYWGWYCSAPLLVTRTVGSNVPSTNTTPGRVVC